MRKPCEIGNRALGNGPRHANLATELSAAGELAGALISAASHRPKSARSGKWTPSLEQILHRFGCRDSLTPALVARVIDPFLLHHHSLAFGFFNWASQQPGFYHTSDTYQSILKSLSLGRQCNNLEKLLKQVKALNIHIHPSVYGTVISSHIAARKSQVAFSIFDQVGAAIFEVGSDTCNSLLAALSSEGNVRGAQKVLDEMLQRGNISLTTVGFGVFIWRFCRDAQVEQILKLLDDVKNRDFSGINGSIIAVLVVHGLCSESRAQEALQLLDDLRKRECKPDFIAYRIVAEAFREMGCVVDVVNALKKKRKLGVAPRANDYREFIFALIAQRLIYEAKELAQVIVSGNFPLEDDVLNALIGSVSTIDPSSAVSFLKFMLSRRMFPTLLTLTNLSRNLCKHDRSNELVEIFDVLSASEYFTDIQSYNVKILFLCEAGKLKEGYESLQEMKKKGLVPDVSCYNTVLKACCREDLIRPAKKLWDEMFANGCPGNVQSYCILLQKLVKIGEVGEAYMLFRHMLDKGVLPDETIYTSLLAGLCQAKDVDTALTVINKADEQDVELSHITLSTFIIHLCREGFFLPASNLLTSLTSYLGNLDAHVTFLKYLADAGEVSLAIEHLRWIKDNSPRMLHALHTSTLSFSYSSKLRAVLKSFEELQESRQNFEL